MKNRRNRTNRKGMALLVVLFIVMAITILSLGFLSRSDVELACGENMILRTQMDYLAESGLEHARGLILNDSNCLGNWEVAGQQLTAGADDYYDVAVVKSGAYNYQITSDAYREKNGERVGRSSLEAELRLDPCIAFWTETSTTVPGSVTITGDVYCNGTLTNNGTVGGDVFAAALSGTKNPTGHLKAIGDLSLTWPQIEVTDYSYNQTTEANSFSGDFSGVLYCSNDIELPGNVSITGMLIVDANLTITGSGNVITAGEDSAGENFPAMLVTGDLIIASSSGLNVNGLVVVNGAVQIGGTTSINGGLFVGSGIAYSGGSMTITAVPSKTAITTWPSPGNPERWSPVAGAFFKSIDRNQE
ncbi:MAG: hypothetical protein PHY02_08160 [Phycisphaerae bacterium]|nr:hypothetical protein [Phycisphaerae bacterium]